MPRFNPNNIPSLHNNNTPLSVPKFDPNKPVPMPNSDDKTTKLFAPMFLLESLPRPGFEAFNNPINIHKYFNPLILDLELDGSLESWQDISPANMTKYSNGKPVLGTIKFNKHSDGSSLPYYQINYGGVPYDSDSNPDPHPELENFYLDNVIISVKQKKMIVDTPIMGFNGTISEYIGLDSYDIKLEGTIIGSNGVYPLADVTMLTNYLNLPASIFFTCPYLNDLFGITYLKVKDYDIKQDEGGISYQKYSISCDSDNLSDSNIMLSPYGSGTI